MGADQSAENLRSWRGLYKAALFETDASKVAFSFVEGFSGLGLVLGLAVLSTGLRRTGWRWLVSPENLLSCFCVSEGAHTKNVMKTLDGFLPFISLFLPLFCSNVESRRFR
jgi:hypothetical protein